MSGEDPACSLPVSAAVNMHQHERAPLIFPHNSTGFVYVCALHNLIDVTSINTMKLKIRFTFFFFSQSENNFGRYPFNLAYYAQTEDCGFVPHH